jgi:hypothetical protein
MASLGCKLAASRRRAQRCAAVGSAWAAWLLAAGVGCGDDAPPPRALRFRKITLTESFALQPASSVSGLYLAHPEARYFSVDRITREQVEDYSRRKGMSIAEVERWLAPNLGYDA